MKTQLQFLLLVVTITIVFSFDPENKYCVTPKCRRGSHTMCRYHIGRVTRTCGIKLVGALTIEQEQNIILHRHNVLRSRVYNGQEIRGVLGSQPPAKKISLLQWNSELAMFAQLWSEQCEIDTDDCRNTEEYKVGQHFVYSQYLRGMDRIQEYLLLEILVDKWYDEVKNFNSVNLRAFIENTGKESHTLNYTQFVWEETTDIGCGVTRFSNSDGMKILLICNYAPKGNIEGDPVYVF